MRASRDRDPGAQGPTETARNDAGTPPPDDARPPAPEGSIADPAGSPEHPDGSPEAGFPANPAAVGTGLRIAVTGRPGPMSGAVRVLGVAEGLRPQGPHGPRHLDAVLTDAGTPPLDDTDGAPVIMWTERATTDPHGASEAAGTDRTEALDAEALAVGPGTTTGPWPKAVVDTAVVNPIGVRFDADGPAVICGFGGGGCVGEVAEAARGLTGGEVVIADFGDANPDDPCIDLAADPTRRTRQLRRHRGVIDDAGLHADAGARASWLAELACAGVPVVLLGGHLDDEVARALAPPLRAALEAGDVDDLADAHRRDRLGVAQRRAALREHGAERAWRAVAEAAGLQPVPPPTVSVLLATNRPERVLAAVARFGAFRYLHRELVVALHGDGFDTPVHDPSIDLDLDAGALAGRIAELAGAPTTVLRAPGSETLGEVLNRATWAAGGEVVTKLDDDDRYDHHHLDDLVDALRYSRAELVGKGSEFIHLGEIDVTIRRLPKGAESTSRTVAGGTLMLGRDTLRDLGGWQRAPRSVDQLLIDDVLAAGGRLHRTHGYGFVLDRHVEGHTWSTSTDYFLRRAVAQWPGLALQAAGFTDGDPGAAHLPR